MAHSDELSLTFGTWNVQSLKEKKREVFAEIERERQDIVVLTETKLRGSGVEDYDNYRHLYSGFVSGAPRAGVSILLRKGLVRGLKWESVNERIIKAKFKICNVELVVLGVYWPDEKSTAQRKDIIQEALKSVLEGIKKNSEIVMLGDFNARVGASSSSKAVGRFAENDSNNNGKRLTELCEAFGLKIQNTFFQHEDKHKYTWYSPWCSLRTVIDYCITRQDSNLKVEDVRACRWFSCGSDHMYLESAISFPYGAQRADQTPVIAIDSPELRTYRTYLLYSKTVRALYQKQLDSLIEVSIMNGTVRKIYKHLKDIIHKAAFCVLGEESDKRGEFVWDKELKQLNAKYLVTTDKRLINFSTNDSYATQIKNEVWDGICSTLENKSYESNNAWNVVHELFSRPHSSVMLQHNKLCEKVSNCILKNIGLSVISDTDLDVKNSTNDNDPIINVDLNDVKNAFSDFNDCIFRCPGGINMKLLIFGSEKMNILLTAIIRGIFRGEDIPDDILENFIDVAEGKCLKQPVMHPHSIMRIIKTILTNKLKMQPLYKNTQGIIEHLMPLEATFILRLMLQKCFEKQNSQVCFATLDLERTHYNVPRDELLLSLKSAGVSKELLHMIARLYSKRTVKLVGSTTFSNAYCVTKGISNCKLDDLLFEMYIAQSFKAWYDENTQYGIAIDARMLLYVFSDHKLIFCACKPETLRSIILSFKKHMKGISVSIGYKNIQYFGSGCLKLGRSEVVGKDIIDCGGSVLELDGRSVSDVENRVLDSKMVVGFLCPMARDETISRKCKRKIFDLLIMRILIQGCETWTLTKELKDSIESVETQYWKWCCENYPERYTKSELKTMMGLNRSIIDVITLKQIIFYATIKQNGVNNWLACIMDWHPKGPLKSGRPRKKWLEGIEEFIRNLGQSKELFIKTISDCLPAICDKEDFTAIQNTIFRELIKN